MSVSHTFVWPSTEAETVYITGSFDNWSTKYELSKEINRFCRTISIPVDSKIYYKFIIDDEWRTSDNDKIECDNSGNLNNVLTLDFSEDLCSDRSSEFTSISYPSHGEGFQEVEFPTDLIEEDLTSSVQITLKDTSSINGSFGGSSSLLLRDRDNSNILPSKSLISKLRSIFHHQ